eukprot:Rhum_TRINITY_DN1368_c0_g1::Rhum_TRINITY_DN1368_c0_g1_i1::g.3959::m.3959
MGATPRQIGQLALRILILSVAIECFASTSDKATSAAVLGGCVFAATHAGTSSWFLRTLGIAAAVVGGVKASLFPLFFAAVTIAASLTATSIAAASRVSALTASALLCTAYAARPVPETLPFLLFFAASLRSLGDDDGTARISTAHSRLQGLYSVAVLYAYLYSGGFSRDGDGSGTFFGVLHVVSVFLTAANSAAPAARTDHWDPVAKPLPSVLILALSAAFFVFGVVLRPADASTEPEETLPYAVAAVEACLPTVFLTVIFAVLHQYGGSTLSTDHAHDATPAPLFWVHALMLCGLVGLLAGTYDQVVAGWHHPFYDVPAHLPLREPSLAKGLRRLAIAGGTIVAALIKRHVSGRGLCSEDGTGRPDIEMSSGAPTAATPLLHSQLGRPYGSSTSGVVPQTSRRQVPGGPQPLFFRDGDVLGKVAAHSHAFMVVVLGVVATVWCAERDAAGAYILFFVSAVGAVCGRKSLAVGTRFLWATILTGATQLCVVASYMRQYAHPCVEGGVCSAVLNSVSTPSLFSLVVLYTCSVLLTAICCAVPSSHVQKTQGAPSAPAAHEGGRAGQAAVMASLLGVSSLTQPLLGSDSHLRDRGVLLSIALTLAAYYVWALSGKSDVHIKRCFDAAAYLSFALAGVLRFASGMLLQDARGTSPPAPFTLQLPWVFLTLALFRQRWLLSRASLGSVDDGDEAGAWLLRTAASGIREDLVVLSLVPVALLFVSMFGSVAGTPEGFLYFAANIALLIPRCEAARDLLSHGALLDDPLRWGRAAAAVIPVVFLLHLSMTAAKQSSLEFLRQPLVVGSFTPPYSRPDSPRLVTFQEAVEHILILLLVVLERRWIRRTNRGTSDSEADCGRSDASGTLLFNRVLYEFVLVLLGVGAVYSTKDVFSVCNAVVLVGGCIIGRVGFLDSRLFSASLYTYVATACVAGYIVQYNEPSAVFLHFGTVLAAALLLSTHRPLRRAVPPPASLAAERAGGVTATLLSARSAIARVHTNHLAPQLLFNELFVLPGTETKPLPAVMYAPATLKFAALVPYILLGIVFVDGASGLATHGTVSKLVRVTYAIFALSGVPEALWLGRSRWRVSYAFYGFLLLYWWFCSVGAVPEWLAEGGFNKERAMVISGLLWWWGAVMDSPYWLHVLADQHLQALVARREGMRVGALALEKTESLHNRAAAERHTRRAALADLQHRKVDLNNAWRTLMRKPAPAPCQHSEPREALSSEALHPTPTKDTSLLGATPPSNYGLGLSPSLLPEDTVSPLMFDGRHSLLSRVTPLHLGGREEPRHVGSGAARGETSEPSRFSMLCAFLSGWSYKPVAAEEIETWLLREGPVVAGARTAWWVVTSNAAGAVYLSSAFHFLVNPCLGTVLPIASVLLYAMCACPHPVRGYWLRLMCYYQFLIVAKALLLSLSLASFTHGSIARRLSPSNAKMLFFLGWRANAMQPGDVSLVQFASWELLLLGLLLFQRYCLQSVWGMWREFRAERFALSHPSHKTQPESGCQSPPGQRSSSASQAAPQHSDGSAYPTGQWGMWGGVKVERDKTLGGAATQLGEHGLTLGVPPELGRTGRRLWRDLFDNSRKTGVDMYLPSFALDIISWVVTLTGFSAVIGTNDTLGELIENNLFPGALVLVLLFQVIFMIVDRVIYLKKSLQAKAICHVLLTIFYLTAYLLWCYVHMETYGGVIGGDWTSPKSRQEAAQNIRPTLFLELYALLKIAFLAFAALQVRGGYPDFTQPHFFSQRFSSAWYAVYSLYRGIPFLFEFRSILDWTFTKTTLPLSYWLRLEDITHEVYVCQCDREEQRKLNDVRGGVTAPFPEYRKFLQGALLLSGLVLLFFFPLLWYSTYGPYLTENYVAEASVTMTLHVGDQSVATLYDGTYQIGDLGTTIRTLKVTSQQLTLSTAWAVAVEKTRQSLVGFALSYGGTRTAQMLALRSQSSVMWGLSPATAVNRTTTSAPVTVVTSVTMRRPLATTASALVTGHQSHTLTASELAGLHAVFRGKAKAFHVPLMLTPVTLNRLSELRFYEEATPAGVGGVVEDAVLSQASTGAPLPHLTNKIGCGFELISDAPYQSYWNVSCDTLFENGNPPVVSDVTGVGSFPFTEAETSCIKADVYSERLECTHVAYDSEALPVSQSHAVTGPYFIAVSDMIANGSASMIPSIGVVALYTTFVLAVGRVLRSSLTGDAAKLQLTDMDDPSKLSTLIEYISMARAEGDLHLEHGLYREVVHLLRSPESMRQWLASTGTPLPHDVQPPQLRAQRYL